MAKMSHSYWTESKKNQPLCLQKKGLKKIDK